MTISTLYDVNYYENGIKSGVSCYENYRWIPETIVAVKKILDYTGLNGDNLKILDYGCAKGFYVNALRKLGHIAVGYDISNYAINNAHSDVKQFVTTDPRILLDTYDLIIYKDILEHLDESELLQTLKKINTKFIFVIVPLGTDEVGYLYPDDNKDITHKIKKPLEWWHKAISNLFFIEKHGYRISGLKDKQFNFNEKSCGFFYAKSFNFS